MKDLKTLIKDVERDLVIGLALSMRYKRLSIDDARTIAKEFLDIKKDNSDDFFNNLYELCRYKEIRKAYIKNANKYYEEKDMKELEKLRNMRGGV